MVCYCVGVAIVVFAIDHDLGIGQGLRAIHGSSLNLSSPDALVNVFPSWSPHLGSVVPRGNMGILNLVSVDPDTVLDFPEISILPIACIYADRDSQVDELLLFNIKRLTIRSFYIKVHSVVSFKVHGF